jgi:hypothetical protein
VRNVDLVARKAQESSLALRSVHQVSHHEDAAAVRRALDVFASGQSGVV